MTDPEKAHIRERVLRCQERRRMRAITIPPAPEEHQAPIQEPVRVILHGEDGWEEAVRQERLSLLAHHVTREVTPGSGASGSTQPVLEERIIHLEHASYASPSIVTTRRSDGAAIQRDRRTGRTRLLVSGEFHPPTGNDQEPGGLEPDSSVSAINVGAVKGDHSDDHYCMLDSGANVMVIPWKEGMEGDRNLYRAIMRSHLVHTHMSSSDHLLADRYESVSNLHRTLSRVSELLPLFNTACDLTIGHADFLRR